LAHGTQCVGLDSVKIGDHGRDVTLKGCRHPAAKIA
jgi:hypothetical protein